jgi:hypothetical protein
LLGVEELRYDGKPLGRKTEKQVADLTDRYGSVCAFYQPALNSIKLLNVPDAFTEIDDYITYSIAVAPSSASTGMDSTIIERYRDGIISGAVGLLFGIPRKTWSSPMFAQQYMMAFAASIAAATTDSNQEFSRRVPRTMRYGGI